MDIKKGICCFCNAKLDGPMGSRVQVKDNGEVVGLAHISCYMDHIPGNQTDNKGHHRKDNE